MSFNVTQCPACESTFNTNSRVLAAAAGKVRCGACLNVFEAIDNFLILEEADSEQSQDESVFVGNNPEEFFDPSSFLTRSALREPQNTEPVVADLIDEHDLLEELEQSETLSEDFFATVAEELQSKDETPQSEIDRETGRVIEGDIGNESAADRHEQVQSNLPVEQPNDRPAFRDDSSAEHIDASFEEEILESFSDQQTQPAEPFFEEPEKAEPEAEQTAPGQQKGMDPALGIGLSASFTFKPNEIPEVRIGEPEAPKQTVSEIDEPTDAPNTENTIETDREELDALEEEADEVLSATSEDFVETKTESLNSLSAEETGDPSPLDEAAEHLPVGEEIDIAPESSEPDSQEYVSPLEPPIRTIEDEPVPAVPEQVEDGEAKTQQPTEPTEQQPDTTAEEEESTEAIRARALETELSDEEALEAIPKENLAALGSMSTPVELLARRESRLLRSTLLFLSILLLGGLLAAQYLWQRMDVYSQLAQLRPFYEFTCVYIGCEVPAYSDIDSIRSENLSVQTHPSIANGLMVNTIIRNTSDFEQAFPILILSFNSADNTVIALREFSSDEYLDPALRTVRAMPASTPVQIELAIMDPGPEAVNYTLAFRWP